MDPHMMDVFDEDNIVIVAGLLCIYVFDGYQLPCASWNLDPSVWSIGPFTTVDVVG